MNFVLVHGAWHGGWSWHKVADQLRNCGHRVETPDLPGGRDDRTPLADITLEAYIKCISQVLASCSEPAVLVGHSLGGLTITGVAEAWPERVQRLVYLAAPLVVSGESLLSLFARLTPTQAFPDFLEIDPVQQICRVKDDPRSLMALYSGCSDADIAYAKERLVPQSMGVYATPLVTTQERYEKVQRIYITCRYDPVTPPEYQAEMMKSIPCQEFVLNTGHFPLFSAPEALSQILVSLCE